MTPQTTSLVLSEKHWQRQVVDLAEHYGWLIYHTFTSKHSAAGFPDLVMVRGTRIIFAELKVEKVRPRVTLAVSAGRPAWLRARDVTDPQAQWLEALRVVGASRDGAGPRVDSVLWRPSDFPAVHDMLKR